MLHFNSLNHRTRGNEGGYEEDEEDEEDEGIRVEGLSD